MVTGIAFLLGFYVLLVGSKVAFAYIVARGGTLLSDRAYQRLIIAGGVLLLGLGVYIIVRALA